jgi:hypothetical protein
MHATSASTLWIWRRTSRLSPTTTTVGCLAVPRLPKSCLTRSTRRGRCTFTGGGKALKKCRRLRWNASSSLSCTSSKRTGSMGRFFLAARCTSFATLVEPFALAESNTRTIREEVIAWMMAAAHASPAEISRGASQQLKLSDSSPAQITSAAFTSLEEWQRKISCDIAWPCCERTISPVAEPHNIRISAV